MGRPKKRRRKPDKNKRHMNGRQFEREILGLHEMPKFRISRGDFTLEVCLINAVLAQPKDHDPKSPTDKWLIALKNGIEKIIGSEVLIYLCVDLPVDLLKSTDLFVVSMEYRSFSTIDLTTYPESFSRADLKFTPAEKESENFSLFCQFVASGLAANTNRMTERMFQAILQNKLPV